MLPAFDGNAGHSPGHLAADIVAGFAACLPTAWNSPALYRLCCSGCDLTGSYRSLLCLAIPCSLAQYQALGMASLDLASLDLTGLTSTGRPEQTKQGCHC